MQFSKNLCSSIPFLDGLKVFDSFKYFRVQQWLRRRFLEMGIEYGIQSTSRFCLKGRLAKMKTKKVEEFTAGYYGLCTAGGMLSAGTTHLAITPLDVLKVNMQVYFSGPSFFFFFSKICMLLSESTVCYAMLVVYSFGTGFFGINLTFIYTFSN